MGILRAMLEVAADALDEPLRALLPTAQPLAPSLVRWRYSRYWPYQHYLRGWRATLPHSGKQVFILQPASYPEQLIDIYIADRSHIQRMPHVDLLGRLCLAPSSVQHHPANHVAASFERIARADALLSFEPNAIPEEEWTREIRVYWDSLDAHHHIVSLLAPRGPSRQVASVFTKRRIYVADDSEDLTAWLDRKNGRQRTWRVQPAVLLWRDAPVQRSDLPRTYSDLLALHPATRNLIGNLLRERGDRAAVIIGSGRREQAIMVGVVLEAETPRLILPASINNFAETGGAHDAHLKLQPCSVQRADSGWLAFRGGSSAVSTMHEQRVAVLGCGSLSSGIVPLLAKSGVGHLTLVDPQVLTFDNITRNELGASVVGQNKAVALKRKIERALPHIECDAIPSSWTSIDDRLSGFDLIISTMGIWQQNVLLNRLAISQSIRPVIYAWLEQHAVAAHAVLIRNAHACIECGFQDDGRTMIPATEWSGETQKPEPGCGGIFQPYGAVDIAHAHALVAELALEVLARRVPQATRWSWLGSGRRLVGLGGHWSAAWEEHYGIVGRGNTQVEVAWPRNDLCRACGAG